MLSSSSSPRKEVEICVKPPSKGIVIEGSLVEELTRNWLTKLLDKFIIYPALAWYDKVCKDMGYGLVYGSVFWAAFDFSRGMYYNAPQGKKGLSGGFHFVKNNGFFHHGPVVAAIHSFQKMIPSNVTRVWAVSFGVVCLVRTKNLRATARSATTGAIFCAFLANCKILDH